VFFRDAISGWLQTIFVSNLLWADGVSELVRCKDDLRL